jgi:hypothetical protein
MMLRDTMKEKSGIHLDVVGVIFFLENLTFLSHGIQIINFKTQKAAINHDNNKI